MSTKSPLISVIVPNYNHGPFLRQRIDSILNQTFQDFELIILDDCSSDNSKTVIESYRDLSKVGKILYNEINSGSPFKQWNKGIELASGEYIWIAESDDFADVLFLEKIIQRFQSNKTIDIVFTQIINVNADNSIMTFIPKINRLRGELLSTDFTKHGKDLLIEFMPDICLVRNASSAVFRKSILNTNTRSFVKYSRIGDLYFWVSLCLDNRTFSYLNEPLSYMRNHEKSVRSTQDIHSVKYNELRNIHLAILKRKLLNFKVLKAIVKFYYIKTFR